MRAVPSLLCLPLLTCFGLLLFFVLWMLLFMFIVTSGCLTVIATSYCLLLGLMVLIDALIHTY